MVEQVDLATHSLNIGALIIRIEFGAHYIIFIIRNPQNSIGNYLVPYVTCYARRRRRRRPALDSPCRPGGRRPE